MLAAIVACEVGFWAFILAGLVLRYLLGWRRAGAIVLACVPIVDLVLLVVTVLHLRSGAEVEAAHGLAAIYLGVSVAFGPTMLRWADARFAHRFAGGAPPPRPPKGGPEHARRERRLWYLHVAAFAIGAAVLHAGALLVDATQAQALREWIPRWVFILMIDFVWSFSYTIWPRSATRQ